MPKRFFCPDCGQELTKKTAHKNQDVQAARVQDARVGGLGGHGSSDSNSKRNDGTSQGLNRINKNK